MKHILKFLIIIIIFSCQTEDNNDIVSNERRSEVMVENNVFLFSNSQYRLVQTFYRYILIQGQP